MWTFIQDQILGMKWLNTIIGKLLLMVGLDVNSRVGGSIQFFIYDTIKITVCVPADSEMLLASVVQKVLLQYGHQSLLSVKCVRFLWALRVRGFLLA